MILCVVQSSKSLTIDKNLEQIDWQRGDIPFLTYTDNWDTIFSDYDLVTRFFPIVSQALFDVTINSKYQEEKFDTTKKRIKFIDSLNNGLSGIGSLLRNRWFRNEELNRVLNCERITSSYWLFDLNDNGKNLAEENIDYFLRIFVSQSYLSEDEKVRLEFIKETNPIYYSGV